MNTRHARLIAPAALDGVHVFFPDPWPKKRHHKRRLIQPDFLASLHRACRTGARVRFATDVASYADEALFRAGLHPLSPGGSMKAEHHEALRDGVVELCPVPRVRFHHAGG